MNTIMTLIYDKPIKPTHNYHNFIKSVQAADINQLFRMYAQAFNKTPKTAWLNLHQIVKDQQSLLWKLTKNRRCIVGMASSTIDATRIWIGDVVIKRKLRGQGLGEQLMRQLMSVVQPLYPQKTLAIKVRANNKPALALYDKLGFRLEP